MLRNIILIGSWCIPFYKQYYFKGRSLPPIKTRDMDLLVPTPGKIRDHVDIPELLKDLGFVIGFSGSRGYIKLEHPDLIVEFLVPERGRGSDKPYSLPRLGLNAQTLRFLDLLTRNTIHCTVEGIQITLPHPANFSFQKLITSGRRTKKEKKDKDREAAAAILKALIDNGDQHVIKDVFGSISQKWQKNIVRALEEAGEDNLTEFFR